MVAKNMPAQDDVAKALIAEWGYYKSLRKPLLIFLKDILKRTRFG